jgi:tripartite-type tricarboxylate transporter receptor subunit TctC
LRALAVTGSARWYTLPDVPTMIESGFPGFVSDTFNALFAPAGTPREIVERLSKEARAAMQRPEVRDATRRAGYEIVAGTPEQLGARLVSEIEVSKELAAKAGVKAE